MVTADAILKQSQDSVDQISSLLREFVKKNIEELENIKYEIANSYEDCRLLKRVQVAKLLNCSISQIDRWVKAGKLLPVDLDTTPRFDPKVVREFKTSRQRKRKGEKK